LLLPVTQLRENDQRANEQGYTNGKLQGNERFAQPLPGLTHANGAVFLENFHGFETAGK
jgi:hypothetical protein